MKRRVWINFGPNGPSVPWLDEKSAILARQVGEYTAEFYQAFDRPGDVMLDIASGLTALARCAHQGTEVSAEVTVTGACVTDARAKNALVEHGWHYDAKNDSWSR